VRSATFTPLGSPGTCSISIMNLTMRSR
jgi:hypothetical protein